MDIWGLKYLEQGTDIRGPSTRTVIWMYGVMTTRNGEWVYDVLIPGMSLGTPLGLSLVKEILELIFKINGGYTGSSRPGM